MQVSDLPLAPSLVAHFKSEGITELYPPQAATVESGICRGENVVAAMPTASGKTFVAELALLTADGPGLYVCPLRALAREKYEAFDALPGLEVGVSTGDFDATGEELAGNDIIVATSEKVDSAIRNGASWVDDLACVVVDEVHLLDAPRRGPTLEVTLATLRRRAPDVQVVALSATVDNPEAIADWLDAALVESDWRPIDLRTGVYADGEVTFDAEPPLQVPDAPTPDPEETDAAMRTAATAALVRDAVEGGGQCLAFVRSRREAATLAERLAEEGLAERFDVTEAAAEAAAEAAEVDGTVTGERLSASVSGPVWGSITRGCGRDTGRSWRRRFARGRSRASVRRRHSQPA